MTDVTNSSTNPNNEFVGDPDLKDSEVPLNVGMLKRAIARYPDDTVVRVLNTNVIYALLGSGDTSDENQRSVVSISNYPDYDSKVLFIEVFEDKSEEVAL